MSLQIIHLILGLAWPITLIVIFFIASRMLDRYFDHKETLQRQNQAKKEAAPPSEVAGPPDGIDNTSQS